MLEMRHLFSHHRIKEVAGAQRGDFMELLFSFWGCLSVFLLAGLIRPRCPLRVTPSWFQSIEERDQLKANLTEHLQESNTKLVSSIEERDQLKANLTEMTKELKRLQSLSKQISVFSLPGLSFDSDTELVLQDGGCSVVPVISSPLRLLLGNKADETAEDKGADLVVIESYEEQKFLTDFIKEFTWIGLNDREKEGDWKWIDETPLTQ
ncbi:hypothetical protein L3Q82_017296, partial [Scortum barcoo]